VRINGDAPPDGSSSKQPPPDRSQRWQQMQTRHDGGMLAVRLGRSAGDVIGVGVLIAKNSNTLFKAA